MSRLDEKIEILPLGDSALIVRVRESFEDAPEETMNEVLGVKTRIEQARLPGVIECTSAFTTVGVVYDPVIVVQNGAPAEAVVDWLAQKIRDAVAHGKRHPAIKSVFTEIVVCFEDEFALDLEETAAKAGISPDEVIKLYCAADYRVNCIGFTPGFPFLSGLTKKLVTPRRAVPRKEVPAGSVAIGGAQTGIYPVRSPGGWNVIGRTPLRLFDPLKNPPAILSPGDRVRFRAINRQEFGELALNE